MLWSLPNPSWAVQPHFPYNPSGFTVSTYFGIQIPLKILPWESKPQWKCPASFKTFWKFDSHFLSKVNTAKISFFFSAPLQISVKNDTDHLNLQLELNSENRRQFDEKLFTQCLQMDSHSWAAFLLSLIYKVLIIIAKTIFYNLYFNYFAVK